MKDNSGKGFLSKVMDSDLLLDQYMPEGVGGGDYDFKTNGASEKQKNDPNYHYRGMPIANLSDGTVVFSSAREIGNATAGYAAGRAGMDWNDSKMAFGILQGSQEGGFYAKEGLSTVNAERLGWKVGNNEFYSRSIGGRMVRGFEAYPRGVIGVINILYNKLTK